MMFLVLIAMLMVVALGLVVIGQMNLKKTAQLPAAPSPPPFVVTSPPTETPPPASTSANVDETAGRKIYSNTALGFSIKYPPDWTISEGDFTVLLPQTREDQIQKGKQYLETEAYPREKYSPITITYGDFNPSVTNSDKQVSNSEVTINGNKAMKYVTTFTKPFSQYPLNHQETEVFLTIGDQKLTFGLHNADFINIFDQILTTFKLQ